MAFALDPKLASGCFHLDQQRGCLVLLKNQAVFPWLLVVPDVDAGLEDLHELEEAHYHEVMALVREVSRFVASHFQPEKLNVACIGNQVRQMHIHVVGRNSCDPAWPGVVWGYPGKSAYSEESVEMIRAAWNIHAARMKER